MTGGEHSYDDIIIVIKSVGDVLKRERKKCSYISCNNGHSLLSAFPSFYNTSVRFLSEKNR